MAHKEFSSGNVRDAHEMGRDLTIATVGGFFTGACAVGMPIASLFWKALACAGINTGVNTLQRAAWSEMDDLEDKEEYIFDPEQMLVDFGNGLGIGITVPQLVSMKVYEQPKPRGGTDTGEPVSSTKGSDDMDPPKGPEGSGEGGGETDLFLPDEYYQKMDENIAKAIAARVAEVARNSKGTYTSSDVYNNVVYEGNLREMSYEEMLKMFSEIILCFVDAESVSMTQLDVSENKYKSYNYYKPHMFIVEVANAHSTERISVYENITIKY